MSALDQLDAVVVRSRRDDLVVKAVMVQGGEAEIAGEKTAFARIVMSGVSPEHANLNGQAPRRRRSRC